MLSEPAGYGERACAGRPHALAANWPLASTQGRDASTEKLRGGFPPVAWVSTSVGEDGKPCSAVSSVPPYVGERKQLRSNERATGKLEPLYKIINPFPIQEREPVELRNRKLNRSPVFEHFSDAAAPGQARDADRVRVPVAWANMKGAFGKFNGLRPIALHVKGNRQFSKEHEAKWVIGIEAKRKQKRRHRFPRLPREDIAGAEASVRRRKAGIQGNRIVIVNPGLLRLAHHHLSKADKKMSPRVTLIDQRRLPRKRLGNAQACGIALAGPNIPEMPPREVYSGFAGAGVAA